MIHMTQARCAKKLYLIDIFTFKKYCLPNFYIHVSITLLIFCKGVPQIMVMLKQNETFGKFVSTLVFAVTIVGLSVVTLNVMSFDKAHDVAQVSSK